MQEEQQANAQQVASTCEWRFNLYVCTGIHCNMQIMRICVHKLCISREELLVIDNKWLNCEAKNKKE